MNLNKSNALKGIVILALVGFAYWEWSHISCNEQGLTAARNFISKKTTGNSAQEITAVFDLKYRTCMGARGL